MSSVFFSVLVFIGGSHMTVWFNMELATLSLVPAFFLSGSPYKMVSLMCYLISLGVSSGLFVCGLVGSSLFLIVYTSFYIKFGLFPFLSWVYNVLTTTNWLVALIYSLVFKSIVFLICYMTGMTFTILELFSISCSSTFICLSFAFWLYTPSWYHCWCHMMLASSSLMLVVSITLSLDNIITLFTVYFSWGNLVIMFLYHYSEGFLPNNIFIFTLYILLLLNTPLSLSLFYKLMVTCCAISCPVYLVIFWVLYSFSEQLYLLSYIVSSCNPKKVCSAASLI